MDISGALKLFCQWFKRRVNIQSNPLDKIKVAKLVKHDKKRSEYEVDPFSLDEIEIFLNTAKDIRSGWVNYFQFAFYTGLRTSELYGLKWDDVDWQNESVRIHPLSRIPGFVIILAIGLAIIGYGITLEL